MNVSHASAQNIGTLVGYNTAASTVSNSFSDSNNISNINFLSPNYNVNLASGGFIGSGVGVFSNDYAITNVTNTAGSTIPGLSNITTDASDDLTIGSALSWSNNNILSLFTSGNIYINAPITAPLGGIALNAAGTGSLVTSGSTGSLSLTGVIQPISTQYFNLQGGNWTQIESSFPVFDVNDFDIKTGANAQFTRALGGDGLSGDPYQITDVYGLQGIGSDAATLSYNYILANTIDASATAAWNNALVSQSAGFAPIGSTTIPFSGTFNGNNFTVNNLYIYRPSTTDVGLFGVNTGTLNDIGLINPYIMSGDNGGALAGANGTTTAAGTIIDSYSSNGSVNATLNSVNSIGGLVGNNINAGSSISDSYSNNSLGYSNSTTDGVNFGGLVGSNAGSITDSYANAVVAATQGVNAGNLEMEGGLVGTNSGTISQSYSAGSTTFGIQSIDVGGFVGNNTGSISDSYSVVNYLGTNGFLDNIGSFAGLNSGNIATSYGAGSVPAVTGDNANIAGFIGDYTGGTLSNDFFDTTSTGISHSVGCGNVANCAGVTGDITATLQSASTYTGWNITSTPGTTTAPNATWYIIPGETRPILLSEWSTTISTPHQLQLIAAAPDASYTLSANLNLSGTDTASDIWATSTTSSVTTGQGFVPITFGGTLNGNGYTISDLLLNSSGSDVGLFGVNNGSVSNLSLFSTSILGTGTDVGSIAGINNGTINSSYTSGTIAGLNSVGGIAGLNNNLIENSYNTGTVTGSTGSSNIGGLVGNNSGTISDAYSTGVVSGTSNTGGLAGANSGAVTDSFWSTSTSGQGSSAGGTGEPTANLQNLSTFSTWNITATPSATSTVPNNIWFIFPGYTSPILLSEWNDVISNAHQLQLVGAALDGNYTLSKSLSLSVVETNTNIWGTSSSSGNGFAPIGSSATPFSGIFNGYGFINNYVNFAITGLYIKTTTASDVGLFGDSTGTLENISLTTAAVTGGNDSGILVGDNAGVVNNINTSGTLAAMNATNVGGIAGLNEATGSVTDSNNTANLSITGTSSDIGGIVGNNAGDTYQTSNTGNVTTTASQVGGLVGMNSGSVDNSYSAGTLTNAASSSDLGGLVGNNSGSLSNDYSVATVSGNASSNNTGGLVGNNSGTITDSYSSGTVSGGTAVGGLIGLDSSPLSDISNSFWDMNSSGQISSGGLSGSGAAGYEGMTTSAMQTLTNYQTGSPFVSGNGWDITATPGSATVPGNTWFIFNGETRPILLSEWSSTITNAHQLQLMGAALATNYTILNTINLSVDVSPGDIWGGTGFAPIGTDPSLGSLPFSGTVTGNNLTISNLTIDLPNNSYVGLFGENIGTLNNINLTNANVTGGSDTGILAGSNGNSASSGLISGVTTAGTLTETLDNAENIGGIAGANANSKSDMLLSTNTATIIINGSNVQNIGGLTGTNIGLVEGASNTADSVSSGAMTINGVGDAYIGGIIGYNTGTTVSVSADDTITATVPTTYLGGYAGYNGFGGIVDNNNDTSTAINLVSTALSPTSYIGGVVGFNAGTIDNPENGRSITITGSSAQYVGGIVGASTGTVTGNAYSALFGDGNGAAITVPINSLDIGGQIGWLSSGSGTNLYNTATITAGSGSTNIGGLAGFNNGTLTSGYNSGTITGDSVTNLGGIVGNNQGTVSANYNYGTINATSNVSTSTAIGGVAGLNGGIISNDYNIGTITASTAQNVGGFVGDNTGTVNTSYNSGIVNGGTNTGGFVGLNEAAGNIANSFWDTDTSLLANGFGSNAGSLSTLLGGCFSGTCTNLGTANLSALSTYSGWSITDVPGTTALPATTWFMFNGDTRPFLVDEFTLNYISNIHEFQAMGIDLGGTYRLVEDMSLTPSEANPADIWGGHGFVPIGTGGTAFTGSMFTSGDGLQITNLYIDQPTQNDVGFVTVNTGTIRGISIVDATIIGGSDTGGLVGSNGTTNAAGTLSDDFVSGSITGSGTNIGGLAGTSANANSAITNSLSLATVNDSGTNDTNIGGLVGSNLGSITFSSFGGTVDAANATDPTNVGGLAGLNSGTITGTENLGAVLAPTGINVGALVGNNSGNISTSLGAGFLDPSTASQVGGLIGLQNSGILTNNFFDTQATGVASNLGCGNASNCAGITGDPTATLFQQSTYTGWNFVTDFGIDAGLSYPYIQAFYSDTAISSGIIPPRVINGTTTPGATINIAVNGVAHDSVVAGANGDFYFLEGDNTLMGFNNTIANSTDVLIYGTNGLSANTVVVAPLANGTIGNLILTPNTVDLGSTGTALTGTNTLLSTAVGSLTNTGILYSVSGANITLDSGVSFLVPSSTTYTLNGNITAPSGNIQINAPTTLSGSVVLTTGAGSGGAINITGNVVGAGRPLTINNDGSSNISGVLSGLNELIKLGAGTLTLSNVNTYATPSFIEGGILNMTNASALGTGTITINQVGANAPSLELSGNGENVTNAIVLDNGSTLLDDGPSGANNEITGAVSLTAVAGSTETIDVANAGEAFTIDHTITGGSSTNILIASGNGQLLLPVATTYSGATTINNATVTSEVNNALPSIMAPCLPAMVRLI